MARCVYWRGKDATKLGKLGKIWTPELLRYWDVLPVLSTWITYKPYISAL